MVILCSSPNQFSEASAVEQEDFTTEARRHGEEGEGIYHGGTEARRRAERGDASFPPDGRSRDCGKVAVAQGVGGEMGWLRLPAVADCTADAFDVCV